MPVAVPAYVNVEVPAIPSTTRLKTKVQLSVPVPFTVIVRLVLQPDATERLGVVKRTVGEITFTVVEIVVPPSV